MWWCSFHFQFIISHKVYYINWFLFEIKLTYKLAKFLWHGIEFVYTVGRLSKRLNNFGFGWILKLEICSKFWCSLRVLSFWDANDIPNSIHIHFHHPHHYFIGIIIHRNGKNLNENQKFKQIFCHILSSALLHSILYIHNCIWHKLNIKIKHIKCMKNIFSSCFAPF